ncbi:hypothetical protein CV023_17930 [Brevibacterium sp. CCUG 69071]|nr:hypothetical protein [Brevibacterium sp. CCUG 69071]
MVSCNSIWDKRHDGPIKYWADTASVLINSEQSPTGKTRHIVQSGVDAFSNLALDSLYVRGRGDVLIVSLHGALVRNDVELPRFEWLAALESRSEHKLFIADSMLFKSENLTLGWYIGNESCDLPPLIANYVKRVMYCIGADKVVFVGSSGGGYASLAISTYIDNSSVVCFTPQTNVWKFSKGHTDNLLSEAFPSFDNVEDANSSDPRRFSLIERYREPSRKNKFIYIQNSGDVGHLQTHFKPFAESLGVRLPNGRTFDQSGRFITFDYGDGHVAPPKHRLSEFLDLALEDLEEPKKEAVVSAGKTGEVWNSDFVRGSSSLLNVPPELNSYYLATDPPLRSESPNLSFNVDGVPMRVIDDVDHDHPVLQAQYMLKQLNTLRRTSDPAVEGVVRSIVARWKKVGVESRGAHFIPYLFEWNAGKQQPPWYSAMAQGQALSAVSRLYEIFPEREYLEFAATLFRSFELLPSSEQPDTPWVVDIDSSGYLWLEEYPYPGQGKCVINGHLFAAWGIYDYWRVFSNEKAYTLASAALESTKHYILQSRNRGWSSHYDLNSFFLIRNYHQTHISQMEMTYNLTGNPYFLKIADLLESDFPSYQRWGSAYLEKGAHDVFKLDNINVPSKVLESGSVVLDKATAFDFAVRTKVEEEEGVWLRLSSGELSGWWVREEPPRVFPRLCFDRHYYQRPRNVILPSGKVRHNTFNEWGSVIDLVSTSIEDPLEIAVSSRALWNGIAYYQVAVSESNTVVPAYRWIQKSECID